MGIFQFFQDLLGNVTDSVQTPLDEITQSVTDNELLQGAQDMVGNASETITSTTESVTGGATDAVDQIKQKIGL